VRSSSNAAAPAAPSSQPNPETKVAAAGNPAGGNTSGNQDQGRNTGDEQRANTVTKADDNGKANASSNDKDKKDEPQRSLEQRQADRADRLAKAGKARKGEGAGRGDGEDGQTEVSMDGGRDKAEENQMRQLAEAIKASRQTEGSRGEDRRGEQRKLGQLYNDTVQKKTPISGEVDALVQEQMKDAPERLVGQAQIAEDDGDATTSVAGGGEGAGGQRGGRNPFGKTANPFAAKLAPGQAQGQVLAQGGFQQGNSQGGDRSGGNFGQPTNSNSGQATVQPAGRA
jgi:hypothetical protein